MNNKPKSEGQIKSRVLFSYAVIVVLIAAILFFTFSSFQKLTQSSDALAQPNQRINLLHEIIISIYHAESNIRAYTLVGDEFHLDAYFEELSNINKKVDSLYLLAEKDTFFKLTIDSINIQLLNKTRLLDQLIQVRKLDQNSLFYEKALGEIIQAAEDDVKVKEITHTTHTDEMPLEPEPKSQDEITREKDNLFVRIRDLFSGKRNENIPTDEERKSRETMQAQRIIQQIRTDSIITIYRDTVSLREEIESTLIDLMYSVQQSQQSIQRRENRILMEDKKVMDRIWNYITLLEDYESDNAINEARKAHDTVQSTTTKIFYAVLLSMIVLLVFASLFITDVNKSKYYKKQLIFARAKAEQLLHVKQRFLANISHEIRTPLHSIIGFSQQLRKVDLPEKPKTYVDVINQSSMHLLDIVNDILDFSKIEANKIRVEEVPFDIKEIANQVFETLSVMAQDKKLEFRLDLTNLENPYVKGDPFRIKQIMLNIAGNAIKFTSDGYVRMIVSDNLHSELPEINTVRIRVTDTGRGISISEQEQIFEEFSQGANPGMGTYGGTGLGLSICKKLVELMKGTIELYSQPGKGSVFTVFLPLRLSDKSSTKEVVEPVNVLSNLNAKILIADDDRLNRLLVKTIASQNDGMSLSEAEDASRALIMLRDQKFDLIITDIQMPGMSGLEMTKQLRSSPEGINKDTPILACTADITHDTLQEIKESGMNDYVLKPFDEVQLVNKIFNLIGNSHPTGLEKNHIVKKPKVKMIKEKKDEKPYDLDGLIAFTGNNPKSLAAIIEVFIKDNKENLKELEIHSKNSNFNQVSRIVHKMTNMFELIKAEEACFYLEMLNNKNCKSLTQEEVRDCVKKLIKTCNYLIDDLANDVNIIDMSPDKYSSIK